MVNILGSSSSMDPVRATASSALSVAGASVHLYGKAESRKARKMGHITLTAECDANRDALLATLLSQQADSDKLQDVLKPPLKGRSHPRPLVGIIMGSDSDLPALLPATKVLDNFGVAYELTITSAHRTPERMVKYAKSAAERGLRVIIAGAGRCGAFAWDGRERDLPTGDWCASQGECPRRRRFAV